MIADEMFDAVMDEADRVADGKVKYSESWIGKLDGKYHGNSNINSRRVRDGEINEPAKS